MADTRNLFGGAAVELGSQNRDDSVEPRCTGCTAPTMVGQNVVAMARSKAGLSEPDGPGRTHAEMSRRCGGHDPLHHTVARFITFPGWDTVRSIRLVPSSLSTWGDPGLRRLRVSKRQISAQSRGGDYKSLVKLTLRIASAIHIYTMKGLSRTCRMHPINLDLWNSMPVMFKLKKLGRVAGTKSICGGRYRMSGESNWRW
jgi:hypothetical protein